MSQTGNESLIHLRFTLGLEHSEILLLLSTPEYCLQRCETSTQEKTLAVLFLVISQLEGNPSCMYTNPHCRALSDHQTVRFQFGVIPPVLARHWKSKVKVTAALKYEIIHVDGSFGSTSSTIILLATYVSVLMNTTAIILTCFSMP